MKGRMLIVGASTVLLALIQIGAWAQSKYVPKENECSGPQKLDRAISL